MKLLKPLTTGRLATSKWALLGGAVLWLSVALATPAQATNYVIDPGGAFSGSFELDINNLSTPFTTWDITLTATDPPFSFTDHITPGSFPNNLELQSNSNPFYVVLQQLNNNTLTPFFQMTVYLPGQQIGPQVDFFYDRSFQFGQTSIFFEASETGTYSQVPEPTALLLLAIGLLALAGSRWLPGRRERQQLG